MKFYFFFFNDTATTEIYTLSLHDALPILIDECVLEHPADAGRVGADRRPDLDRKSTRLNSSHSQISYAVFCLKKKKTIYPTIDTYHTVLRDNSCYSLHSTQIYTYDTLKNY